MAHTPGILFTAFEPSGDALVAPVVERLRELRPDLPVYALGGERAESAGATVIEHTTAHATMLLGAASQAWDHKKRLDRLKAWLAEHPIAAVVPVDSPAANWSVCGTVRKAQPRAKAVHLVCPQVWAWAAWRVRKLRRLTDRVLCLLPFEVDWLRDHDIPATFVGHPIYDRGPDRASAAAAPRSEPGTRNPEPVLALLPGSRRKELSANWPDMLPVASAVAAERGMQMVAAVRTDDDAALLRSMGLSRDGGPVVETRVNALGEVLAAADTAVVVSGTVTLDVARAGVPMAVTYRASKLQWRLIGWWLVATRTFTLPNLIGRGLGVEPCVPEVIPYFGGPALARAVRSVATDEGVRRRQRELYARIEAAFAEVTYREAATRALLGVVEGG